MAQGRAIAAAKGEAHLPMAEIVSLVALASRRSFSRWDRRLAGRGDFSWMRLLAALKQEAIVRRCILETRIEQIQRLGVPHAQKSPRSEQAIEVS